MISEVLTEHADADAAGFTEINLFGVYIAPVSVMMVAAWVFTIGLRRLAARFGRLRHVWHPALFVFAVYMIVLSSIVLLGSACGLSHRLRLHGPHPHRVRRKGYDAEPNRDLCCGFGAEPCIHKRKPPHGSGLGGDRWPVERSNAWVPEERALGAALPPARVHCAVSAPGRLPIPGRRRPRPRVLTSAS
jgi:hypothetical protein